MDDASKLQQFREELRSRIEEKINQSGSHTTDISRESDVEAIGTSLSMTEPEACDLFFALQGDLWDVSTGDLSQSKITSDEVPPPPRAWIGINDVYLP